MAAQDLMVVFSNPAEGRDDEFNLWYDDTHIPEVLEIDGVVTARRYELGVEDPDAPHRYLAVYELDQPCTEVLERLVERASDGGLTMSDALDATTASMRVWRAR
jgi:hypothetical protein